jgi:hypothetical protein
VATNKICPGELLTSESLRITHIEAPKITYCKKKVTRGPKLNHKESLSDHWQESHKVIARGGLRNSQRGPK